LLDQMVGSELLSLCRHAGPYHPTFVARVLGDPTAVTLLVERCDGRPEPIGFVRLYNVHLAERFGFLETAIIGGIKGGWGIEASRLFLAYAMDTLDLHRVESKVYEYNVLSANALRRNGFQQEGLLREARLCDGRRWDVFLFAILRDEMARQRAREAFPYMGFWPGHARP
jgi:RimJ/RimL family protein N-acetyltransferase